MLNYFPRICCIKLRNEEHVGASLLLLPAMEKGRESHVSGHKTSVIIENRIALSPLVSVICYANVAYTVHTSLFEIKENAESRKAAPLFRDAVNSSLDSSLV